MNNKKVLTYAVIITLSIFITKMMTITLNTITAFCIAGLIIYKYNEKINNTINRNKINSNEKIKNITPEPEALMEFDDVIDFIFSVQDMYKYNQQSYENFIQNLNNFFNIYKRIKDA